MKERLRQQVLELEAETKKVKELHARLPEGAVRGGTCVRRGKEGGGEGEGGLRGWGRKRWVLFVG